MHEFGTYELGRLKYRTPNEARGAAEDLGLADVHSTRVNGQTAFMPGSDMADLNDALERQGLPVMRFESGTGGMSDGMMGGLGLGFGMDDDGGGGGLL